MREDILFTINPQIRKSFLGRVQNLGQVAQTPLLVEHLVSLRELFSVGSWSAIGLEDFAETLDLVQESFARSLAIFGVKVVFLI